MACADVLVRRPFRSYNSFCLWLYRKTEINAFDVFRGLAIIAVVAIHAIYFGGSPHSGGFVYYRQLLNFCVPAFFFISGYWASRKQIESVDGIQSVSLETTFADFISVSVLVVCCDWIFGRKDT